MEMHYCPRCGRRLIARPLPQGGEAPWCEDCRDYRFPLYSAAVVATVLSEDERRMLLVWQYGEPDAVLPAGYIDKGETAEQALARELREELGMTAQRPRYLGSHWYAPSETLMLHYAVTVPEQTPTPNWEVDAWRWVEPDRAAGLVRRDGLAERLLREYERYSHE